MNIITNHLEEIFENYTKDSYYDDMKEAIDFNIKVVLDQVEVFKKNRLHPHIVSISIHLTILTLFSVFGVRCSVFKNTFVFGIAFYVRNSRI